MDDQTHFHIETPPKLESHSQTETQSPPPPNLQISHSQSTSVIDNSHPTPPQISLNSHNPSKIPIRPQKIRKLSFPPPTPNIVKSSTPKDSSDDPSVFPTAAHSSKNRRRITSQASQVLPQFIKPLTANGEVELAIRHLRAADPLLAPLIDIYPPPHFETHHLPFLALTKSILYQQLAYKAGTSIYTRFVSLCGSEESICPDSVLALSTQQLKQIGVSGRKASYLYDLANKYKSGILSDETIVRMDDRSLFTMLSMVKGIGSWSVHMFMIFSLHRPDVLPVSDLGVRKGVQLLYGLDELPRPSQMEQLCEKWRPYRSVGAWYMWRFVEGKGTSATGSALTLEGSVVQPLQQIESLQDGHQLQFVESVNGIGACIWNQ